MISKNMAQNLRGIARPATYTMDNHNRKLRLRVFPVQIMVCEIPHGTPIRVNGITVAVIDFQKPFRRRPRCRM